MTPIHPSYSVIMPLYTEATPSLCPYTPKLLRHYAPIHRSYSVIMPLYTEATPSLCPYTPKLLRHYAPIHPSYSVIMPLYTEATPSLCPYTPKLLRHYAPIHAENIQMFRIGNILFFAHFCRAYATSQNTLFCILNLKMN